MRAQQTWTADVRGTRPVDCHPWQGERYAADAALRGYRVRRDRDGGAALRARALARRGRARAASHDGVLRLRALRRRGAAAPRARARARRLARARRRACASADGGAQLAVAPAVRRCASRSTRSRCGIRLLRSPRRASLAELGELAFARPTAPRASRSPARRASASSASARRPAPLDKRGARLAMRNRDPRVASSTPIRSTSRSRSSWCIGREAGGRARSASCSRPSPRRTSTSPRRDPDRVDARGAARAGIDLALFPGPAPREVLERFSARVGRTPLPPRWALGHHQSRWALPQRDARCARSPREIRRRGIPTRRDPPRHRLHGRLPRLHLAPEALPRPARAARRARARRASASSRSSTRA